LKILVISDVHGNFTALNAVLRDAGKIDRALCAGDIVGYGPDPNECVEVLSAKKVNSIAGNHDVALVTGNVSGMNVLAARAVEVNRQHIGFYSKLWLESLSIELNKRFEGISIAVYHGSPSDPLNEYVFPGEALKKFDRFFDKTKADILILGHTHVPFVNRMNSKILLNPGSVGQPRDGDPRSSYIIIEINEKDISISPKRVEYDIEEVRTRMKSKGLPGFLSERLFLGR
jgi:putative phosphoesterase